MSLVDVAVWKQLVKVTDVFAVLVPSLSDKMGKMDKELAPWFKHHRYLVRVRSLKGNPAWLD